MEFELNISQENPGYFHGNWKVNNNIKWLNNILMVDNNLRHKCHLCDAIWVSIEISD